jgi:DNA-binding IclR family transcriptional regulator
VLRFLEEHPDDVFPYRDQQLARSLEMKVSALSFTLWDLHRQGLIDKQEVDDRVYFGSRRAISELRSRLGLTKQDPFQRARANAERIRARTGNIDVLELLDAVRGPWD